MTQTPNWTAAQATAARAQRCRELLDAIRGGIEDYADAACTTSCNWTHAGTIAEVRRQLQQIADFLGCPSGDLVVEQHACPHCGERHPDMLIWVDDEDETVCCANCGKTYQP